jgi:predicted Zn-dependent protease
VRNGVLIPIVLLGLVAACATNPVTGRRELAFMSEAQEIAIAQESDAQIKGEMGVYNDPELQAYVSDIGQRMARISERPQLPWRFTVVDVPAVNAFAVPGGAIYVTRGILPFLDSEAELAGVIGHEIGHVTARHSAQQYTRQVSGQVGLLALGIFVPQARPFGQLSGQALGVLFMKYGRDDELQADRLAARYEATLGWDPAGAPAFLSTLGRLAEAAGDRRGVPNWMSTHPEPLSRVRDIQPTIDELKSAGSSFATNRDEWLRRVDGIVYGDNPEQGLARGSAFLHPVLRFRIDFPGQWEIANNPQQVVAQEPSGNALMLLRGVDQPQGQNIQEIARDSMETAGFRITEGEAATISGLDAYLGVYHGQIEGLGAVAMRAAYIRNDGQIYLVAGIVPPDGFGQADGAFLASIRSFRRLSAAEAEGIRPNRVDMYVVRTGDTWQSIAERSGGVVAPETLAIMNQATLATQPQLGARIKIVVGG